MIDTAFTINNNEKTRNRSVEDWFNTYLGYLQCVFRCTRVPSIFGHIDVLIDDRVHVRTS